VQGNSLLTNSLCNRGESLFIYVFGV
jgi:hypothetical protein